MLSFVNSAHDLSPHTRNPDDAASLVRPVSQAAAYRFSSIAARPYRRAINCRLACQTRSISGINASSHFIPLRSSGPLLGSMAPVTGRGTKFRKFEGEIPRFRRGAMPVSINGLAETPERFHENAVVSRLPTYGF